MCIVYTPAANINDVSAMFFNLPVFVFSEV